MEAIPETVMMKMMPVQFDVGEMIIEKGGPVSCGYIFTDGKLNVLSVNTRGAAYTYVSHYEAHFVGLMEIYSGHDTYCCSLKVEKRCSGWRIDRDSLFDLLYSCDPFKQYLICYWANQFYDSTVNESRYPINTMNIKLIDYLLKLAHNSPRSGQTVRIKIRREDLAAYLGCSRRTVYRLLSRLKEEALISSEGNMLIISEEQRKRLQKRKEE